MSVAAPLPVSTVPEASRPGLAWFLPSFADMIFISVIAWTFMAGDLGWSSLLTDGDSGWHIRTGQQILATHSVPHTDPFSFSKAGEPWFAWEWLSDVLYAVLFNWLGLKGVVLMSGVVISATATIVCRHMVWRGANPLLALPLTLVTLSAASIHFHARPHIFTLLFLAIGMWMLDADRRKPAQYIWWLVPMVALWTNLHGGFPVFLVLLALLAIGCGVRAWLGRESWTATTRYAILTAACSAATLINPYGWHLHTHILAYLQSDWIQTAVQEFQAPTFRGEGMMHFQFLLFAGILTAAQLIRRYDIPPVLFLLFLAHESLMSARHIPLYAIVAVPLVATELSSLWGRIAVQRPAKELVHMFWSLGRDLEMPFRRNSVWAVGFVVALLAIGAPLIKWPTDFPSIRFPVSMAGRYGAVLQQGRLFTNDQWGDYLLFRDFPKQKVFMDGRSDFYGAILGKEYLALSGAQYNWRDVLQKHNFDVVLAPPDWALSSLLKQNPDWQLIADDHRSLLFVRRDRPALLSLAHAAQGSELPLRP